MDNWHRRRLRSDGLFASHGGCLINDNGAFCRHLLETNYSFWFLQLAESRALLSEAATREEMSQLELDAATADVSSEREVSAANARRGVATDALRVEVDGAQHRAEAAQEVTRLTCAHTKQG